LLVDNFITYGIGATGGADAGNSEDTPITELVLADVIVRNYDMQRCFSAGDLSMGIGLMIYSKARANAERVQIENAGLAGVFVNGVGTEAALKDISVTGTHSIQCGAYIGQAGRGFDLSDGAHISLERALVQNNREVGMQVGPGTIVGMKNVEVADTLKRECADGEDTEQNACYSSDGNPIGVGIGLGVFGGGKVTGETVWLHGNRFQAGLRLSPYPGTPPEDWPKTGGTTEIRNMRIENNSYGAHLLKLPDGYDFFQSNPELFVENNLVSDVSTQESEDFSLQIIGIPGKIQ
jgi:hypothetical protein